MPQERAHPDPSAPDRGVDWIRKPQRPGEGESAPDPWYAGATLNTCYNALDRHVVHGRGDDLALVHVDPATQSRVSYTFARLLEQVAAFAGALRGLGVEYGDPVVVCLPAVPEAVVAMLACARLGAVHAVLPDTLTDEELARVVDDVRPQVVIGRNAHRPASVVVTQRPGAPPSPVPDDVEWDLALRAGGAEPAECVEVRATDPLFVLPGGSVDGHAGSIVRDNASHAVAMAAWRPDAEVGRGRRPWGSGPALSTEAGHACLVYGPLFNATAAVLDTLPDG